MSTQETTDDAQPPGRVIGANLRRLREARQLTQVEAADVLRRHGLSWQRSHVAAIEAGNRESADVAVLALIAAAFDVPVSDLFAGEGRVRLAADAVATRAWLRDCFAGRTPNDTIEVIGTAARWLIESMAGEPVSFQADAELAHRLGLRPEDVYQAAIRLWGRTLHQERDARVAGLAATDSPRVFSLRAHRGHITRQLAEELGPHLPGPWKEDG